MGALATTKPTRRSQAERTATTRAALLEATIDCVIGSGYSSVTTAEIAKRAGLTRGAVAHHFTSKGELVTAAVRHLADRLIADHATDLPATGHGVGHLDEFLDAMRELHRSPLHVAALSLSVDARGQPDLSRALRDLDRSITVAVRAAADTAFADVIPPRAVCELVSTTVATMRGLAVGNPAGDDVEWTIARRHLRSLWDSAIADARHRRRSRSVTAGCSERCPGLGIVSM